MFILVGHEERSFSLQIKNIKNITSIVQWVKDFSMISILCILLLLTAFWQLYNISFSCKYPIGGWRWWHWTSMWGVFRVGNEDCWQCWCLYCRLGPWLVPCSGVSVVDFGQINAGWVLVTLMTLTSSGLFHRRLLLLILCLIFA